jgi:hypothetical protein
MQPGQYLYLWIRSSEAVDGYIRDEETWWGLDGSGEVRNRSTRQDKYPDPESGIYGPGEFTPWKEASRVIAELSTDPDVLVGQLEDPRVAEVLWSEPADQRSMIGGLLFRQSDVTPALRAALFEVASRLDGVERSDNVDDPAGRTSIALSFRDGAYVSTWYFDAATRQAMAWTTVNGANEPAWVTISSGIVDRRGVRPADAEWLVPPPG